MIAATGSININRVPGSDTEAKNFARVYHGVSIEDRFSWLEETSAKTTEWLEKQAEHTLPFLTGRPAIEWLNKRYDQLCRVEKVSAPQFVKDSERMFFTKRCKDKDRDIWLTKKSESAPYEVLIDPNTWPKEESLDFCVPSDDGRYVAYGVSKNGDENPTVRIMDLETGQHLIDTLSGWRINGISWHANNKGFFYTGHPVKGSVPEGDENYWNSCYFHDLGSSHNEIVFQSSLKTDYHAAGVTEDGLYEIFIRETFSRQDYFFRPSGSKEAPQVIVEGIDAHHRVDIYKDKIYIMTDYKSPKSRLVVTDVSHPTPNDWKDLIPEHAKAIMKEFHIIEGRIYIQWLENASSRVTIHDLNGIYLRDLPLPALGTVSISGFQEVKKGVKVTFESYTYPRQTFIYDFETHTSRTISEPYFKIDQARYETKQVWYTSNGTRVSMFILKNANITLDGSHPVLMYGYGGFNIDEVPVFSTTYLSWLEAGGIVACPNLRGGGEYGREWYDNGKKEKKQNVFDDFIAAAEYLIDYKYTNPGRLAIAGGSNGGLLVGAVMTQRPWLFKAALCQVPLLDMLNYHKWGMGKIWEDEYGSSDKPEEFEYLHKYSPYHKIVAGNCYPATLFTASDEDARVKPCHAMKMVARLQEVSPWSTILLSYQQNSGHAGGTTLTQIFRQNAEQYGFLMDQLGMKFTGAQLLAVHSTVG